MYGYDAEFWAMLSGAFGEAVIAALVLLHWRCCVGEAVLERPALNAGRSNQENV